MKERAKQRVLSARELIALNVRSLREEAGLSQEGLAVQAGFHRTYISQLERCKANVTADGLDRMALALGVAVDQLLRPATANGL